MSRSSFCVAVALLVTVSPALCFAWGRDGHQIAAEIASRHLDAKAQACVQGLLPGQSLADVSVWADEIKGARRSTAPLALRRHGARREGVQSREGLLEERVRHFGDPQAVSRLIAAVESC